MSASLYPSVTEPSSGGHSQHETRLQRDPRRTVVIDRQAVRLAARRKVDRDDIRAVTADASELARAPQAHPYAVVGIGDHGVRFARQVHFLDRIVHRDASDLVGEDLSEPPR